MVYTVLQTGRSQLLLSSCLGNPCEIRRVVYQPFVCLSRLLHGGLRPLDSHKFASQGGFESFDVTRTRLPLRRCRIRWFVLVFRSSVTTGWPRGECLGKNRLEGVTLRLFLLPLLQGVGARFWRRVPALGAVRRDEAELSVWKGLWDRLETPTRGLSGRGRVVFPAFDAFCGSLAIRVACEVNGGG
jgi:hypothetical protein